MKASPLSPFLLLFVELAWHGEERDGWWERGRETGRVRKCEQMRCAKQENGDQEKEKHQVKSAGERVLH